MLKNLKNIILDTLFPVSCLSCGKEKEWLCRECLNKIKVRETQVCPYCEKNTTESEKVCPNCKNKYLAKNKTPPLSRLIVASSYADKSVSRLIHLYKYKFIEDLSVPLGKILIKSILENNLPIPGLIIPIPLHKRRLRWRGFNQSELLANFISQNLAPGFSIPVLKDLITRKKYTVPQMKIKNYQERQKNIRNAFEIRGGSTSSDHNNRKRSSLQNIANSIKGKTIMLVDDIATTGSTMDECAKVLKLSGAKEVWGVVLARQEVK